MKLAATILACLLCSSEMGAADMWANLHPEFVVSFGCSVKEIEVVDGRERHVTENWISEAEARRSDPELGLWQMVIAYYPHTTKGRHQAEKACSKWTDGTTMRVNKAGSK